MNVGHRAIIAYVIGTTKAVSNPEPRKHARTWTCAGSLLTDAQGHLVFTEENRRGQQEVRDGKKVGDRDETEMKREKENSAGSRHIDGDLNRTCTRTHVILSCRRTH